MGRGTGLGRVVYRRRGNTRFTKHDFEMDANNTSVSAFVPIIKRFKSVKKPMELVIKVLGMAVMEATATATNRTVVGPIRNHAGALVNPTPGKHVPVVPEEWCRSRGAKPRASSPNHWKFPAGSESLIDQKCRGVIYKSLDPFARKKVRNNPSLAWSWYIQFDEETGYGCVTCVKADQPPDDSLDDQGELFTDVESYKFDVHKQSTEQEG